MAIDYSALSSPFRLRTMESICARLKTITPANNFVHDLSDSVASDGRTIERVFRGRTMFGAGDPLPMLSVLEDTRQDIPTDAQGNSTSGVDIGPWKLAIMGFIEDDMDHPTDGAHFLSAEVVKILKSEKLNRYNLFDQGNEQNSVQKINVGRPVVRPAEAGISDVAFFFLPVHLETVESEDPFA